MCAESRDNPRPSRGAEASLRIGVHPVSWLKLGTNFASYYSVSRPWVRMFNLSSATLSQDWTLTSKRGHRGTRRTSTCCKVGQEPVQFFFFSISRYALVCSWYSSYYLVLGNTIAMMWEGQDEVVRIGRGLRCDCRGRCWSSTHRYIVRLY